MSFELETFELEVEQIANPIKTVGDYEVIVRVHDEVDAKVAVKVRPGK